MEGAQRVVSARRRLDDPHALRRDRDGWRRTVRRKNAPQLTATVPISAARIRFMFVLC
jgi:hypothetical protein